MRGLLPFAAAALFAAPVLAQTDEPIAMDAVDAFMIAFNAKDGAAMRALSITSATVTLIEEREGPDRLRVLPLSDLILGTALNPREVSEPVWQMVSYGDGPVATVMARYDFSVGGEHSHCGHNIWNLVRQEGEWKIASITYSHVTEDCPEVPAE